MPEIGEIQNGSIIGLSNRASYIYLECINCHKQYWVEIKIANKHKNIVYCKDKICQAVRRLKIRISGISNYWDGKSELKLGMVKHASELGDGFKKIAGFYIYDECPRCHEAKWREKRWVGKLCGACSLVRNGEMMIGEKHGMYRGYRHLNRRTGYITLRLQKSDPLYCMARKDGRVQEHKYLYAKFVAKRPLERWEVVHHINEIKDDNRLENLELRVAQHDHVTFSILRREVNELRKRVTILEAENALLKHQIENNIINID